MYIYIYIFVLIVFLVLFVYYLCIFEAYTEALTIRRAFSPGRVRSRTPASCLRSFSALLP